MKQRIAAISTATLLAAVTCSTAFSAEWLRRAAPSAGAESSICANFSSISGDIEVTPGKTYGYYGTPQPGEKFTFSFSGSGTGSFRIVGDPAGSVTLAGPATAPGSLSYTASNPLPSGTVGVGFYFDSGSGSLSVQASCTSPSTRPAPAIGARGLVLLGALLALAGIAFSRRKWRGEARR